MNTVVWWESQIERDYIYLLEIDPEVVSYQEQPLTITYTMEGKVRKYTPDFLVNQLQKTLLVEVKPDELEPMIEQVSKEIEDSHPPSKVITPNS